MKKIYLAILVVTLAISSNAQTNWTKYSGNPVLSPDDGRWDESITQNGSVIFFNERYHIWYNGATNSGTRSVGHATSPDGINWTKDSRNPVFELGSSGSWDQDFITCGDVSVINDTLHMWYYGYKDSWENSAIGHAVSSDGVNWTRDPGNPVLTMETENSWTYNWIEIHEVVHDGQNYHMWYVAGYYPGDGKSYIGHAISPNGSVWTRDPSNPVLSPSSADYWDYPIIEYPAVVFDGSIFHMWYGGGGYQGNFLVLDIGYATSTDGTNWTRYSDNPVLKRGSDAQDAISIWTPSVVDSAGVKYKMWYRGDNGSSRYINYAESVVPAWKQMASMDVAKGTDVTFVIDSLIYVFGGSDSYPKSLNSTTVYNTATNEWLHGRTSMPIDLNFAKPGIINNKAYIVGGWRWMYGNHWGTIDNTFEYDPTTDGWEQKIEFPKAAGGMATSVLNDKLYVFGGWKDYPDVNATGEKEAYVYDPETNNWAQLADLKYGRGDGATAHAINGKIYVFGGAATGGYYISGKPECYDPVNNTWTIGAEMPLPVAGHISLVYNDKVYFFGGDTIFGYCTNSIQEYDPQTDKWQIMEPMPFKRSCMAGHNVGKYLYLLGGYPENSRDFASILDEVWRFNLDSLQKGCEDVIIQDPPDNLMVDNTYLMHAIVMPSNFRNKSLIWSSDNEAVATVDSVSGLVTCLGEGTVMISAQLKYGSCDNSITFDITTGINEIKEGNLAIYPNPTNNLLTIETGIPDIYNIDIIGINGQLLLNKNFVGTDFKIDLSCFVNGIYFISVKSKDFVTTRKIIKL